MMPLAPLLAAGTAPVSTSVTVVFSILLAGMIACLALEEKLHAKKSLIAGGFAALALLLAAACGILPALHTADGDLNKIVVDATETSDHHYEGGHEVTMPVYIPAIDWGVIAIILGSALFVDVTSRSGLFTWIAIRLTKASGGDPLKLLWSYGIMTVVFSALLNNVTAMIIVGSLTAVSLDKLGRRDKLLGFLMIEGLLTNIGGLLTLISSVPNIIVGQAAGISFLTFFIKAAPYVVVATVVTIKMGASLFQIEGLKDPEAAKQAAEQVAGFDENEGVSPGFFRFGAVMLCLFIVTIASASVLPWIKDLGMGYVALTFAAIMLVRYKSEVDTYYRAIDWDLLGFFAALFVVIYCCEYALVLKAIGDLLAPVLSWSSIPRGATMLFSAAGFSSVTDNIPLAAMLAKILASQGVDGASSLWWAVIFGANLGGNLTPIGSASTLVAVTIMHKQKLEVGFARFVKLALPFALVQIALASVYVLFLIDFLPKI